MWRVEYFDSIASTNTWVAEQARLGAPEGLVAHTGFQSAGRGRRDRTWEAPAGSSLLCSLLLRPPLSADQLQLVMAAVSLAAREALRDLCGRAPDLKWPNDLLYDGAKLAGMLAEVVVTDAGPAVVVGLGLNLTAAAAARDGAVSVVQATGVSLTGGELLAAVLERLNARRDQLETVAGCDTLRTDYEAALVTLGQTVRVETLAGTVHGVAVGIDETGRLLVDVDGEQQVFGAGDVVHLRREENV